MKVTSRHTVEIEVRAPTGVSFAVRESGKLVVRAESGQSVDMALTMLNDTASRLREAAHQSIEAAAA